MYQYGRGVPQNYGLAAYWYRRSAEQGNAVAQHLLGLMYDKGFGLAADHVLAYMWLSLAAAAPKVRSTRTTSACATPLPPKMSLGQLADAQYLARAWIPKPER